MKNDYASLIRYLRLKESVSQELLGKKLGVNKSNISRMENGLLGLMVDDLEKALNYLGAEIQIIDEKGENIMKKMNKKIAEKGLQSTDVGYSKNYIGLKGKEIRVEFNLLDLCVGVNKDSHSEEYVSDSKFEEYRLEYTDEEGYGEEWDNYLDNSYEIIIDFNDKENKVSVLENAYEIFGKDVVNEIKDTFKSLF